MKLIEKLQTQFDKYLIYYDLYTELYSDEPIQDLNMELNNKICDL